MGGEPLLKWEIIIETLEKTFDVVNRFTITTNGTLITQEKVDQISPYKRKIFFQVALDGATKKIHDSLRGERAFERVTQGIEKLNNENISWGTSLLLNKQNYYQLENIVEMVEKKGGELVQILTLSHGRNQSWVEENMLSPEELKEASKRIEDLKERGLPIFTRSFSLSCHRQQIEEVKNEEEIYYGCGAPMNRIAILPNKVATPCAAIRKKYDFFESLSEKGIWEAYDKLRKDYLTRRKEYFHQKSKCGECEYITQCLPAPCRIINLRQ